MALFYVISSVWSGRVVINRMPVILYDHDLRRIVCYKLIFLVIALNSPLSSNPKRCCLSKLYVFKDQRPKVAPSLRQTGE